MSVALTSMAILKVNFDRNSRDVLDNFLPFMGDRAFHLRSEAISVPELQDAIREEYGISIPVGVLKTLTKRGAKRGMFRREAGVLYPDRQVLAAYDLSDTRVAMRRQHTAVVKMGIDFAANTFGTIMAENDFDAGLSSFIRENAAPLLATVVDGHPLAQLADQGSDTSRYIIGSFISDLADSNPQGFEYLTTVVKGSLLASALYFPEAIAFSTRLDQLRIYVDTTLLLRAIGAAGPEQQLYASEALSLARRLGARLRCFQHTYDEMIGVLDACEHALRSGGRQAYGETAEFMWRAGWGRSDVVELRERLERKLSEIGVQIRERPEHSAGFTLDEVRLEGLLTEKIGYRNKTAMLRDIDSLTAIYRLRRGQEYRQLERSKAIFVTHNTGLVNVARRYMGLEKNDRNTVPLCIADYLLTTLLWLKEPLSAPELPERRVIADCLAAMQPSDQLWKQYVQKIDDLRDRNEVTGDEYVVLRQSIATRSLIAYHTNEDPEAFTEGTVDQVLAKARERIAAEALADATNERQLRSAALAELARAKDDARRLALAREADAQAVRQSVDLMARRLARGTVFTVSSLMGLGGLVGFYVALPFGPVGEFSSRAWTTVGWLCLTVFAGLTLYSLFRGGSVLTFGNRLERRLTPSLARLIGSVFVPRDFTQAGS